MADWRKVRYPATEVDQALLEWAVKLRLEIEAIEKRLFDNTATPADREALRAFLRVDANIPDDDMPKQPEMLTLTIAGWLQEAHEGRTAVVPAGLEGFTVETPETTARDIWARCVALHVRFESVSLAAFQEALDGLYDASRRPFTLRAAELVVAAGFHRDARVLAANAARWKTDIKAG